MGYLTLAEYRTDVDSALGSKGLPAASLNRWINYGYLDVAGSVDFEATDSSANTNTAIGTPNYAIPTGAMKVKIVKNLTADRLLGYVPKSEYFARPQTPTAAPKVWTRHAGNIHLHPVPDAVYTLLVISKISPTRLATDTAVSVFPDIWDQSIFLLAVHWGLLALGEDQRSVTWLSRAINYISSRMTEGDLEANSLGLASSTPELSARLDAMKAGV